MLYPRPLPVLVLILWCLTLTGCDHAWEFVPKSKGDERVVHVVRHGWHTGERARCALHER